ncbi:hypothetical protein [Thiothrix winogradskyi]|uniref:Uncharacterized protein n=1 Tax=Thiothrix winogradskyi TaxID=96472 RepID=A0ABY3SWK4_9GAMM|nr:hypothetical protein [Thiothrix winogradskyi]UJS23806.1 hypothetical protein L2Y54_17975 [Thiothrix winogradskyi]
MLLLLINVGAVVAAETADEITTMLTWWDDVGSEWEQAEAFIEFAGNEPEYLLADNSVEMVNEQQQQ